MKPTKPSQEVQACIQKYAQRSKVCQYALLLVLYECKHGLSSLHALQILPQWPQLDLSPSGATRPSAVMPQQQQPGSLNQGMALLQAPLSAASAPSSAVDAHSAVPAIGGAPKVAPAPASLPSAALPRTSATEPAAQQPAEPHPSSAHLPESMQAAGPPGTITLPQQAALHAAEPLLDNPDVGVSTSARGGGKESSNALNMAGGPRPDPSIADFKDEAQWAAGPEANQASGGMKDADSQSRLAASVSASILGGNSTATAPDKQQGAPAHARAGQGMGSCPADASAAPMDFMSGAAEAGRAPGTMPADDDISKPVGQAEASKLIGVREDLDQLGPTQPNVPCCSSAGAQDDETLEGQCTEQQQQRSYTGLSIASAQQLPGMPAWQPDRSHSATAVHNAPNGINSEGGLLHGRPPPEMLPQLGVREYPHCSAMRQASAPGLFDPTAMIGQGQSPAANGFGSHSSPTRTSAAGKTSLSSLWQQRLGTDICHTLLTLHPLGTWSASR